MSEILELLSAAFTAGFISARRPGDVSKDEIVRAFGQWLDMMAQAELAKAERTIPRAHREKDQPQ